MENSEHTSPLPIPGPPTCDACGVALVVQLDSVSGAPVVDRGRAMMRCPACGEIKITDRHPTVVRRHKRYNRLVWIIGALMGVVAFGIELVVGLQDLNDFGMIKLSSRPLAIAGLTLGSVVITCEALRAWAAVIDPLRRMNIVEAIALAVFMSIAGGGTIATTVAMYLYLPRQ